MKRVEDALEVIQNEFIQHVREICASLSIEDVFDMSAILEPEQQSNIILSKNNFGNYMRRRYGFRAKSASFGYVQVVGEAGKALSAVFVAGKQAEAAAKIGEGEGQAEYNRLTQEGKAFDEIIQKLGVELATSLRTADVAERFAANSKTSTVVLGFNNLKDLTGGLMGDKNPKKPQQGQEAPHDTNP